MTTTADFASSPRAASLTYRCRLEELQGLLRHALRHHPDYPDLFATGFDCSADGGGKIRVVVMYSDTGTPLTREVV